MVLQQDRSSTESFNTVYVAIYFYTLLFLLLAKYYKGDQIRKGGIGRACGMHRGNKKMQIGFCWKTLVIEFGKLRHKGCKKTKIDH